MFSERAAKGPPMMSNRVLQFSREQGASRFQEGFALCFGKKLVLGRHSHGPRPGRCQRDQVGRGGYQSRKVCLEQYQSSVVEMIAQVHHGLFNYPILKCRDVPTHP